MGVAPPYADLEARLTRLKFRALGRVVAEVITTIGGEPRLSIGAYELTDVKRQRGALHQP
jgi:hypothetical protein